MAKDSTSEPSQPATGRFQFRLRSIFILMAIVAFAFGLVPQWYQRIIVPENLPHSFKDDSRYHDKQVWAYIREVAILNAVRHTPGFSMLALVGCCGLWYAYTQPTKQKSDIWLGWAYGISLAMVVFPPIVVLSYGVSYALPWLLFEVSIPFKGLLPFPYILFLAAIYSCWPLFLKRYWATALLFLYRCFYGSFVLSYLAEVVTP